MEQYGRVVRISDLAELTAKHPVVQKTIYILGLNAAELYDRLIFNVLDAATGVYRPNSRAADTDLVGSDHLTYNDLIELFALLHDDGARPMDGQDYVLVTPTQVYAALLKDPDFKSAAQFQAPDKIWRGEVGSLGGFRLVRSNSASFSPTSQAGSGDADKVYSSFAIGRMAYQIVDLQNIQMYVAAPGGHTDVLQQSRKMGFKFAFKSIITNQDWIRRVRSAGLDSVTNP